MVMLVTTNTTGNIHFTMGTEEAPEPRECRWAVGYPSLDGFRAHDRLNEYVCSECWQERTAYYAGFGTTLRTAVAESAPAPEPEPEPEPYSGGLGTKDNPSPTVCEFARGYATNNGYSQHMNAGTPSCQECRDEAAAYMRAMYPDTSERSKRHRQSPGISETKKAYKASYKEVRELADSFGLGKRGNPSLVECKHASGHISANGVKRHNLEGTPVCAECWLENELSEMLPKSKDFDFERRYKESVRGKRAQEMNIILAKLGTKASPSETSCPLAVGYPSTSGQVKHKNLGEKACPECAEEKRAYTHVRSLANRAGLRVPDAAPSSLGTKDLPTPTDCPQASGYPSTAGYRKHRAEGEKVCAECSQEHRAYSRAYRSARQEKERVVAEVA